MSGLFYRVDPVVSVDEVKEFENVDTLDERIAQKEGMVERAKNLSLNQRGDRNLEKAVEFQIKQDDLVVAFGHAQSSHNMVYHVLT